MRLLTRGYTTGATTVAGSTNPVTTAAQFGSQDAAHVLQSVQITGGSSIASTVGFILRTGPSSDGWSSYVLAAGDSSELNIRIDGLDIKATNWELAMPTTSARGFAVLVFGV